SGDGGIERRVARRPLDELAGALVIDLDLASIAGTERERVPPLPQNAGVPAPPGVVLKFAVELDVGDVHDRLRERVDRGAVALEHHLREAIVGPDRERERRRELERRDRVDVGGLDYRVLGDEAPRELLRLVPPEAEAVGSVDSQPEVDGRRERSDRVERRQEIARLVLLFDPERGAGKRVRSLEVSIDLRENRAAGLHAEVLLPSETGGVVEDRGGIVGEGGEREGHAGALRAPGEKG